MQFTEKFLNRENCKLGLQHDESLDICCHCFSGAYFKRVFHRGRDQICQCEL